MSDQSPFHDTGERLVDAYNRMLERIRVFIDDAEDAGGKGLQSAYEQAKNTAVELGELSREEAEKIAAWLKRDARDAASYMEETGEALSTWLKIDLELIEDRLLDWFSRVADQTRLEHEMLRHRAAHADEYRTGEVCAAGILVCTGCGHELHLHKTARIPPCAKCHGTQFKRTATGDDDQ